MTLPELIYIVISVEQARRLGHNGIDATVKALLQANSFLASEGFDKEWGLSTYLPDNLQRWAGNFWANILYQ